MIAIETKDLFKSFGTKMAVKGIDLCVNEGELFALLGVNGAGKTTTIRMLSCLSKPTKGDAFIFGQQRSRGHIKGQTADKRLSSGDRCCPQISL